MSDTTSIISEITIHAKNIEHACPRGAYRYLSFNTLSIDNRAHQTHILPSNNCLAKIKYLPVCYLMYQAPMYLSYMCK